MSLPPSTSVATFRAALRWRKTLCLAAAVLLLLAARWVWPDAQGDHGHTAPPAAMLALAGLGLLVLGLGRPPAIDAPRSTPPAASRPQAPSTEPALFDTDRWQARLAHTLAHRVRHPSDGFVVLAVQLSWAAAELAELGEGAMPALEAAVSCRLLHALRPGDAACRRDGPGLQFHAVLDGLHSALQRQALVQRVQQELAEAYTVCDHPLRLRLSLGAVTDDEAAADATQLLLDADVALRESQAVASGAPPPVHFNAALGHRHAQRQSAAQAFKQGLLDSAFELRFQPVLTLNDNHLVGVRAELLWQHPTRGTLMAADFVDQAIEAGCIAALDQWQLRTAARHFLHWRDTGGDRAPAWLSVALAPAAGLEWLHQQLQDTGLAAAQLELRLPAPLLAQEAEAAARLQPLRDLGLRLSLEGLGQASASLSALPRLPVSAVTIDGHFVRQIESVEAHRVLVTAVVSLADSLGMATLAYGISSAEQRDALVALGVQLGQGLYFGGPETAPALERWMIERPA